MPIYNGARTLAAALDSIVSQTLADIEIVISDNGSTDATAEICQAYAARDPRIRYFRQPRTLTEYTDNFNFVVAEARAPYFMWAAHDDTRDLDFLERMVAVLDARPGAVLAFGDTVELVNGSQRAIPATFENAGLDRAARLRHAGFNQLHHLYGVWRTDVLKRIRWRHVNWWHDTPLMMAASLLGDFVHVPGTRFYYLYNLHPFFDWKREPGLGGLMRDLGILARKAAHLLRFVWLSYETVADVAGPAAGLQAAAIAMRKNMRLIMGNLARRVGAA
jgi:glycosyltransferase involved in cell wall biosynthesis